MDDAANAWIEPTTGHWQQLGPPAEAVALAPPWRFAVPVVLPDGRVLRLPIRRRPGQTDAAVASLIINQASFEVVDALVEAMLPSAAAVQADVVIGLPTLGMVLAAPLARRLGHARWVPLGYSRKYWYDEALSTEVVSLTSPGLAKRLYLDPNQCALVAGRRVLLVDDAVSSGVTLARAWDLLAFAGAVVAGAAVAMRQGGRWRAELGEARSARVQAVFLSPLLRLGPQGWMPEAG